MAQGAQHQERAVGHWKHPAQSLFLSEEWRLAQTRRANVLLVGRPDRTNQMVDTLLGGCREPVTVWHPGQRLRLPLAGQAATIILHEVACLGREDQRRLREWLEQTVSGAWIISTASASLLSQVERGEFDDTLYFRLNTLCIMKPRARPVRATRLHTKSRARG